MFPLWKLIIGIMYNHSDDDSSFYIYKDDLILPGISLKVQFQQTRGIKFDSCVKC